MVIEYLTFFFIPFPQKSQYGETKRCKSQSAKSTRDFSLSIPHKV